MPKIAAVDLLVANVMLDYQEDGKIERYVKEQFNAKPGDLLVLNEEQFKALSQMLDRRKGVALCRGGTTANTLETLGHLFRGNAEHVIYGVTGKGAYTNIVEGSFNESGTTIHQVTREGITPETAVSFVLNFPDKPPIRLTYPGNAKEIITPETLPWGEIAKSDTLFLTASLRERLDPKVMDALLQHRWDDKKKLILAYPETAFKGAEDVKYMDWISSSADIVLSSMPQLRQRFPNDLSSEFDSKQESLKALRQHMVGDNNKLREIGHNDGQVNLITDFPHGVHVVTENEVVYVPARSRMNNAQGSGCDEATSAGFLAGCFSSMTLEPRGQLGIELGEAKLNDPWPSLENPRQAIRSLPGQRLVELISEAPKFTVAQSTYDYTRAPGDDGSYFIG